MAACSIWRQGHSLGAAAAGVQEATYVLLMLDYCILAKSANIEDLADEAEGLKILCCSEDVSAGSVLSNSCTTSQVRHLCYSYYCQDSYTGDWAYRRVHMLRTRMEYGNMLQRFDCNLQHLLRCSPCKVRNSCY